MPPESSQADVDYDAFEPPAPTRKQLNAEIAKELKRVGWRKPQAVAHCKASYRKDSSADLTLDELQEMFRHLQGLPAKQVGVTA